MPEYFSIRSKRGPKQDVIAAIDTAKDMTPEAKAFVRQIVAQRSCQGVTLDLHAAAPDGNSFTMHLTVTKLY